MRDEMNRTEFSESLDRRLSGLQGDPWLAAKVLARTEGEKPVKKLSATTILVIVLLVLTMAGALATANWTVIGRIFGDGWYYNETAIESPLCIPARSICSIIPGIKTSFPSEMTSTSSSVPDIYLSIKTGLSMPPARIFDIYEITLSFVLAIVIF